MAKEKKPSRKTGNPSPENSENTETPTAPAVDSTENSGNPGATDVNEEENTGNSEETEGQPQADNPANPLPSKENKTFTIKNASIEDQNYIKSLAVNGKTVSQALSEIIQLAKREPEKIEVTKEIPVEVIKEVSKEIEKKLLPGQAVITFDPQTGENIRKVRPFIARKEDYIVYEKGNHTSFVNALVNRAVNRMLKWDFDNVINPL